MQYKNHLIKISFVMVLLSGCSDQKTADPSDISLDGLDSVEREEVNFMMPFRIVSDGEDAYLADSSSGLIYRFDLDKKQAEVNCNDPTCGHTDETCSAYTEAGINSVRREGDQIYAYGTYHIYKIGKNEKEEVAEGDYGEADEKVIFGDYIAYPKDGDIVVENFREGEEVQRFEDIVPYTQGNFYYGGALWYITEDLDLVRLDIKSGEASTIEETGVTRACVYKGAVYYIQVDQQSSAGENTLVRYTHEDQKKTPVAENVFYYNFKNDSIYYITWPERDFCCCGFNGNNAKVLIEKANPIVWSFPEYDNLLISFSDYYTYYIYDIETNMVDYDHPFKMEQVMGQ